MRRPDLDLRFRDAREEDARSVADLARRTFAETSGHLWPREDLDTYLNEQFSKEVLARQIVDPAIDFRLAEARSGLAGYAKIGPPRPPLDTGEPGLLELHRLYVQEARQGVGVGRILLDWTIERARERSASTLCLGVFVHNERALSVYEARGFKPTGRHSLSVGASTGDEVIMCLELARQKAVRV